MKRKDGAALATAAALCAAYLWFFWYRLLSFYGIATPWRSLCAMAACMAVGLADPVPVKLRTVCVMYLGFWGILSDLAGLLITAPLYVTLHRSGILVVLLSAATLLCGIMNGKRTVCTHYRVRLQTPPSHPLRFALLSDIHMGKTVDAERLHDVCRRIEAHSPDALFLAGDICDEGTSPQALRDALYALGAVKTTYGTFAVLGNHDLGFRKCPMQFTEAEFFSALQDSHIHMLDDEVCDCGAFVLIGRRDKWLAAKRGGRKDVAALYPQRCTGPVILLDHQPFAYREASDCGVALQLSGHTHAAQVFPLSVLGRLLPGFYGRHRAGAMTLITSCGLGNRGNRLRSGCTAEYVIIDVQ